MKKTIEITKKTKVAVLCGGLSNEREVSLRSGKNCHAALLRLGYNNAVQIDVGHDFAFQLKEQGVEVAFLALHGKWGEDGTVQGLLELMQIPYTGSGVLASALAMSKPLTKSVLKAHGIPYAETLVIDEYDAKNLDSIQIPTWAPAMVKPLAEGSSVGVEKVDESGALKTVIKETITKYGGAIVEKYIKGQEITVGVLENPSHNGTAATFQALPILELRPKSKAGFYDYEAKYTKGMTEFVLPAELSPEVTKIAQDLAVKTFRALACSGYARVDMMVDGASGQPNVLEVNTLPGMTDTSDLPAMAEVAGISYDALVERILLSSSLDK